MFFGNNAYGIAAAAEIYFGKQVAELTFVEAAFLAGLVRSPSGYDPINNLERSRARFAQVLDRLVDDELLTEFEATQIADEFVIPERVKSIPTRATKRTYYTEALREYLLNESNLLGETYEERYNTLFRGGLRIHTTLNPYLQLKAEEARNVLPDTVQGIDAAIVSLDTKTAAIRAMVGGRGFEPGRNEVNMALAPSQTGSSIKIFILAAALQAGAEPDDIIDGTRGCRLPSDNPAEPIFEITGGVAGGVFTLREQTYRSINCAFARLSQIVGLYRVVDMTYRMASSTYLYKGQPATEREPIQPHASFATGANEMSTLDMAAGMQTIANLGVHQTPYYVDYIDDAAGNRIYTHTSKGERVLDTRVALTEISILKDVLTLGTARHVLSRLRRVAPGGRQDRHPAEQLDRRVRRGDALPVDGSAGARPGALHVDGQHPRVPRRRRRQRPGRHLPGPHLGCVHGAGARLRAGDRLAQAAAADRARRPACTCPASSVSSDPSSTATTLPTDAPPDAPPPGAPDAPGGDVTDQAPPTTLAPDTADGHHDPRRSDGDDGAARSRCTRRSTVARRSRPTCSILGHRFRRRRGRSMLHRADDRRPMTEELLALQAVDTTADQLTHRRSHLPELADATAARAARADWERRRDEIGRQLDELTAEIDSAEHDTGLIDRHRDRLNAQLRTVIAPREAEALQHEIKTLSDRRSALDDRELSALEQQAELDDQRASHLGLEPTVNAALEAAEAALADRDR